MPKLWIERIDNGMCCGKSKFSRRTKPKSRLVKTPVKEETKKEEEKPTQEKQEIPK